MIEAKKRLESRKLILLKQMAEVERELHQVEGDLETLVKAARLGAPVRKNISIADAY
jgi:hypothetical protein